MDYSNRIKHIKERVASINYPIPVVNEVSWANGLGIIRGLGCKGIKSLALSHRPWALGFFSRYSIPLLCPNPAESEEKFVEFLIELGKVIPQKGVFFITNDTYLRAISKNEQTLKEYYDFPFPKWEVMEKVMDKRFQYEKAKELGIAVPKTFYLSKPDEIDKVVSKVQFPVILKPQSGKSFYEKFKKQVFVVNNLREAKEKYIVCKEYKPMLQEIVPGSDDLCYSLGTYVDKNGQVLGIFTGRKLRQITSGFGIASAAESVIEPYIVKKGIELLQSMNFYGVSEVEFKRDPRDNEFKFIEINPRFWMEHGLATACGVNLSYMYYQDAIGNKVQKGEQKVAGKKWFLFLIDIAVTLKEILKRKYSFKKWLSSLSLNSVGGIFNFKDPLPGLMCPYGMMMKVKEVTNSGCKLVSEILKGIDI